MKKHLPLAFLFLMSLCIAPQARARCFYLSAKGNDSNNGSGMKTPWRTLQRMEGVVLNPGDSILLECGSVFTGTLKLLQSGSKGQSIFIGSYGKGAPPLIEGSRQISSWQSAGNNLWKAATPFSVKPSDLFINGKRLPLARYPNNGWLSVQLSQPDAHQLRDTALNVGSGYWAGAEVIVQSSRWTLDRSRVQAFNNHTFYFETPASYQLSAETRYFIQDHPKALDMSGEWFFDDIHYQLLLYEDRMNPNSAIVTASLDDYGIMVQDASFITIEGIALNHQRLAAIHVENASYLTVRNCVLEWSANNGLEVISSANIWIVDTRITDCNNNGATLADNRDMHFEHNQILRAGMIPGRGASGNGSYIGLYITGNYPHVIRYNTLDSTGYSALDFRTPGTLVRGNTIRHFCMVKDDGAGIYTWGNNAGGSLIRDNIIIGMHEGYFNDRTASYAHGIYIDDRSNNLSVKNNTVAFCKGNGLLIHNSGNILVDSNKLVSNSTNFLNKEKAQLVIKRDGVVPEAEWVTSNITITNNDIACEREDQKALLLHFPDNSDAKQAIYFKNNRYAVASRNVVSLCLDRPSVFCETCRDMSLPEWQRYSSSDSAATVVMLEATSTGETVNGDELNWISWPQGSSLQRLYDSGTPSIVVTPPPTGTEVMLYGTGLTLDDHSIYCLEFTAWAPLKSEIQFVPLMSKSPWSALGAYHCFQVDSVRKPVAYYFKPATHGEQVRLNFKSYQPFGISGLRLYKADMSTHQRSIQLLYNTKSSPRYEKVAWNYHLLNGQAADSSIKLMPFRSVILIKMIKE